MMLMLFIFFQSPEYSPSPVSPAPSAASTENPFAPLESHVPMKTINSKLVTWLVAMEGYNFADRNNMKIATEMIVNIIVRQELKGYTAKSFPLAIKGGKVEQTKFTKHV